MNIHCSWVWTNKRIHGHGMNLLYWSESKSYYLLACVFINGWGMGPLVVLVSPCFRENVVVTCKLGIICLDNLLQKNVLIFFFENQVSKRRSFEKKRAVSDILFTFLVTRGKNYKNSFSTYVTHIHNMYIAHPIDIFCLTNLEENTNLSGMVSLWYDSWCWFLFAPFWNN